MFTIILYDPWGSEFFRIQCDGTEPIDLKTLGQVRNASKALVNALAQENLVMQRTILVTE